MNKYAEVGMNLEIDIHNPLVEKELRDFMLPRPKTCTCGRIHEKITQGALSQGMIWFNCSCQTTLVILAH